MQPNYCESCAGPLITCDCVTPRPIYVLKPLGTRCWMHLGNGWTVSISETDTPPAICSVAAWPSIYDDNIAGVLEKDIWFPFKNGNGDKRCHTLADIRDALAEVEAAPPPK